ncbi:MAG TPA: hypothetical protein ENN66_07305 [Proteobacteria bacterium]|nr:hypothetical protein [Pseudomonadota bacterium]
MPMKNLSFSLGYNYQLATTRSRYATAVFVGCFSESMGEQIASVYDDVDYDSKAQVLYLTSTYQPTDKLTLTADLTATRTRAEADVPAFGNNIYYQNFVDVAIYGETQTVPYTQTIMMSYLDYSGSDDYSKLDYNTLDLALGAKYSINDALAVSINGLYRWADDDTAYLGDDYDGKLFIVNTSLTYRF